MKSIPIMVSLAVIVLGSVMLLSAVAEIGTKEDVQGKQVVLPSPLAVVNDIEFKKVKTKFKYKSENVADAKQSCAVVGECPTSYENFNQISSFRVRARESGCSDAVDHSFYDATGVKGRKANRYKQRFTYFKATKSSGHHRLPAYGFFKARIKNGKLKFMYVIPKANEGGKMVATADYNEIRDFMSKTNKYEQSGPVEGAINVGSEIHDGAGTASFKAKKKRGRGKLEKM